jgi:hypothetical protein
MIICAALALRFVLFSLRQEIHPIFRSVTEVLLIPFPGNLKDVDLAKAGFDFHAPIGIGFYILAAAIFSYVISKLIRSNFVQFASGVIDVWAATLIGMLSFGFALTVIKMQPGASWLTDAAIDLVKFSSTGSFIQSSLLNTIFVITAILLIAVLTDSLLKLKFQQRYFENRDLEIESDLEPELDVTPDHGPITSQLSYLQVWFKSTMADKWSGINNIEPPNFAEFIEP